MHFGLRVLSSPVCLCVNFLLVRTITHHPFKLGSLNLDQKLQNILLKVPIVPYPKWLCTNMLAHGRRVVDWDTVELYLQCDHCWLPGPLLGNLAIDFGCFCSFSPNHTYLTYRNFVCQCSVMAETTVKQHAFIFIVFESQHRETRLSLRRLYF